MKTTIWASQLRTLANALSNGGKKPVTTQMLCAALGVDDIPGKARVRRSITSMVKRGEMERIKDGEFRYVPQKAAAIGAYGESYKRMWRIIRTEKAGWTVQEIAGTTRLHCATVGDYCTWLEQAGFIVRCGKQGNTRIFRATQQAREHRETPYPPSSPKDSYAKERSAVCRLVKMFMDPNPGLRRAGIIAECRTVLARFDRDNAQKDNAQNENTKKENSDVEQQD